MQLDAYHMQKTANKVVYNDGKRLRFAYPFLDVADLMDLLYISRSSAVHPTLHSQVHHNVTTSFSQYRPYLVFLCFFGIALFLLVLISSMVGFVYMSEITYFILFCLFNKVPDLTTAMDWFVVCSVHDTQIISRYNLFSNAFMRFSMVHVPHPCGS